MKFDHFLAQTLDDSVPDDGSPVSDTLIEVELADITEEQEEGVDGYGDEETEENLINALALLRDCKKSFDIMTDPKKGPAISDYIFEDILTLAQEVDAFLGQYDPEGECCEV